MGKCSKDRRDVYYRLAKEQGWRARSAFKLIQINDDFKIFDDLDDDTNKLKVVDLCGAPGSWSQAISTILAPGAIIVTVDMQPIAPINGVTIIQADITDSRTIGQIREALNCDYADIIVSDGAPDITGLHDMDEFIQHRILSSALNICHELLRPGGTFVGKIFRGVNSNLIYEQFRRHFNRVYIAKPKSSRVSSIEAFVVAKEFLVHSVEELVKTFVVCGKTDDLDCDTIRSLPTGYKVLDVVQKKIKSQNVDILSE
ncbi:hypothetical protein GJ496_001326 [Pomphorhynchus laevis]|nr:hypothetical protein GJ496_001326 [Pomphorhynchus laevis]